MAIPDQKFREVVFQLLYSYDIGQPNSESMIELLSAELKLTKNVVKEANNRVNLILTKKDEIDDLIKSTSHAYAFERIQTVERNILRIGTYELLFEKGTLPQVVISEAMRLSRKFSTKESAKFINAILDAIHKSLNGKTVESSDLKKIAEELEMHEKVSEEAAKNMNSPEKKD